MAAMKRVHKVAKAAGKDAVDKVLAKERELRAKRAGSPVAAPPPAVVFISPTTVFEIKQMREEEKALAEKLKTLSKDLEAREKAVIVALENGVPPGPGCPPILVEEKDGACRPAWKEECLTLAEKTGLNKIIFEAEVKARTKIPKIKTLVIGNGNGAKN